MYYPNYEKSTQSPVGQFKLPDFVSESLSAVRNFIARIKAWPLKMKAIATGSAILLFVIFTVSIGSPIRPNAQASAAVSLSDESIAATELVPEPVAKPKSGPADYPGEVGCDVSWSETTKDGFQIGKNVVVWNPVKSEEKYLHPGNSKYTIGFNEGYDGEFAWVIPFVMTVSNETSGFGGLKVDYCVTTTAGGIFGNWITVSGNIGFSEKYTRERGIAYVAIVGFANDGTEIRDSMVVSKGEISESGKSSIYGYMMFVDAKKTPNAPNGVENDWFWNEKRPDRQEGVLAVGDHLGLQDYRCKRIASISKDDAGNIVLSNRYEINSGQ